jgi:hypothetical protein
LEKFLLSNLGKTLLVWGKKIQLKNALEYLRRKTLKAEQTMLKVYGETKRREFEQKWHKTVEKIVK